MNMKEDVVPGAVPPRTLQEHLNAPPGGYRLDRSVSNQLRAVADALANVPATLRARAREGKVTGSRCSNRKTAIILAYCCSAGGTATSGGELYQAVERKLNQRWELMKNQQEAFDVDEYTQRASLGGFGFNPSAVPPPLFTTRSTARRRAGSS